MHISGLRGRVAVVAATTLVFLAINVALLGGRDAPLTAASSPTPNPTADIEAAPAADEMWVDPASSGRRWGTEVQGLLTFRGNPTRSWYGTGPVPTGPIEVLWRFPDAPMCAQSSVKEETKEWCGTGWTGQPAVAEYEAGTWVVFGAFDRRVHFLDAAAGTRLLPDFPTGDIIKGSVTIDPDGFPLVYVGSRDDNYRVIAIDGAEPVELWRLSAGDVAPTMWNDDWDGSGLVVDDHLFVGGENSRLHIVKLNRSYDATGRVTVEPELVFHTAGWDTELLDAVGDRNVSIEGSVAISGDTLYFANSGGLVQGWDIGALRRGEVPTRVFRFWTGDDTDATVVVDTDGMLYVAAEYERATDRAREVGQLLKLDPRRPDDPVVWSLDVNNTVPGGLWATPALWGDGVYAATHDGRLMAVDRTTGVVRWTKRLGGPMWQSPVIVDGILIQGNCAGVLRAFDVRDTAAEPVELWKIGLGGCIESTPAVWRGRIYVGTKAGFVYALG